MSKKKRPKKYNPNPANPPTARKNSGRKDSFLSRVKQNWPVWVLSLLMACSLLGRFAARTSRPVPQARTAVRPLSVSPVAMSDGELFTGQLNVQVSPDSAKTYEYHLTLPKGWQGHYETQVQDNIVSFIYDLNPTSKVTLFTLAAYPEQRWQQLHTEPGFHGERLLAKDGIVFVDTVMLDSSPTSNIPSELKPISSEIPDIIHSFEAVNLK